LARPTIPLLELVQERRFDAGNKRHRAKLLHDDSLLDFVRQSDVVTPLYASLAQTQEHYRSVFGVLDRSHAHAAARSFQLSLERLDDNGEPTAEALEALRGW
jgi:hypothetical protein